MSNPFNRPMNVLNVFVNGKRIDPELYSVKAGTIEFVKPLKDIMPAMEGEKPEDGYRIMIEYQMNAE